MVEFISGLVFNKHFKSPTPCSNKRSTEIYLKLPYNVKEQLRKRYRIEYNRVKDKLIKVE